METFSTLLAICAGNSPVPGEFPTQRPVTWSFDVFFDVRLNKRLNKQSWGWWFEVPSRHYNEHSLPWELRKALVKGFIWYSTWVCLLSHHQGTIYHNTSKQNATGLGTVCNRYIMTSVHRLYIYIHIYISLEIGCYETFHVIYTLTPANKILQAWVQYVIYIYHDVNPHITYDAENIILHKYKGKYNLNFTSV